MSIQERVRHHTRIKWAIRDICRTSSSSFVGMMVMRTEDTWSVPRDRNGLGVKHYFVAVHCCCCPRRRAMKPTGRTPASKASWNRRPGRFRPPDHQEGLDFYGPLLLVVHGGGHSNAGGREGGGGLYFRSSTYPILLGIGEGRLFTVIAWVAFPGVVGVHGAGGGAS
jgi:hypothetical protein